MSSSWSVSPGRDSEGRREWKRFRLIWSTDLNGKRNRFTLCMVTIVPEGPLHQKSVRKVKATRQFLWEMELGRKLCNGSKMYQIWNWNGRPSLSWTVHTACGTWQSLQRLTPSVALHLLWLLMLFCETWLSSGITKAALRRGKQQNFPSAPPLFSTVFQVHPSAPFYRPLAKGLLIAL